MLVYFPHVKIYIKKKKIENKHILWLNKVGQIQQK